MNSKRRLEQMFIVLAEDFFQCLKKGSSIVSYYRTLTFSFSNNQRALQQPMGFGIEFNRQPKAVINNSILRNGSQHIRYGSIYFITTTINEGERKEMGSRDHKSNIIDKYSLARE